MTPGSPESSKANAPMASLRRAPAAPHVRRLVVDPGPEIPALEAVQGEPLGIGRPRQLHVNIDRSRETGAGVNLQLALSDALLVQRSTESDVYPEQVARSASPAG